MDTTEVRTPRTAPISCPFESVVEGTAKKWRNNSYVPSIKCTSMWSPISFSEIDVIRSGYEFGDRSLVTDDHGLRWACPTTEECVTTSAFLGTNPTGRTVTFGLPVIREESACAGTCLPCDRGDGFADYGWRFVRRRRSA